MSSEKEKLKQLGLVVVFGLIGYLCNVAATKILTSSLSLPLYGDFSVAWNSLNLVSQIILFGSLLSVQRYLSEYHDVHSTYKQCSFIRWNFKLLLRTFFIAFIVYVLFWSIAWITHLQQMHNFEKYHLAFSVCIFGFLLSLWSLLTTYILSFGYSTLYAFLFSTGWATIQLVVIGTGFYLFTPTTELDLSFLIVAILFVLLAVSMLTFSMLPDNELLSSPPFFSRSPLFTHSKHPDYYNPDWISVARGSLLNNLCFTLITLGPLYILELLSSNENAVGIYNVGLIITGFFQLLISSMLRIFFARIATIPQCSAKENKELQSSVNAALVISLILLVMGVVLFTLFGNNIFAFFNIAGENLTGILLLLLCNIFLNNLSVLSATYLQANGHATFCLYVRLLVLFIVYVLGSIFCLYYEIYGIVTTSLIASLIRYTLFIYRARQLTSFKFSYFL